jgi:hypothetical protein
MRFLPTGITSWPAAAVSSLLAAALAFGGVASAGQYDRGAGGGSSYWPWIAAAVVLGLLGVVAFVSRRRIHAVVGG